MFKSEKNYSAEMSRWKIIAKSRNLSTNDFWPEKYFAGEEIGSRSLLEWTQETDTNRLAESGLRQKSFVDVAQDSFNRFWLY